MQTQADAFFGQMWAALGGGAHGEMEWRGEGCLPSRFPVTEFASASIAAAARAASQFIAAATGGEPPRVTVDRRLASLWFGSSIRPIDWTLPPAWDAIAGDYEASDGWIRLHTNAPHHRAAALRVLQVDADKTAVASAVQRWAKRDLEEAVVAAGGCAAAMHSASEWGQHPQGAAVAQEPLVDFERTPPAQTPSSLRFRAERPLRGIRVLDLTRILAGPVATRFLAGLGADVLRIDPPGWEETSLAPEVTLGKRCARIDLRTEPGRRTLKQLLAQADVLVHGYRPGALDALDFDARERTRIRPGLVDVSLNAYGWTGAWRGRRGFDSLVQMSSGIAEAGMQWKHADRPVPMPVQALDHAAGYLLAAAALTGLERRLRTGEGILARTSLARVAHMLARETSESSGAQIAPAQPGDFQDEKEQTAWGGLFRLRPAAAIKGTPLKWERPASALGTAAAEW